MGVKLRATVNPLEASIEDKQLKIYFYDRVIKEVTLSIPKGISILRQCNFFTTPMNNVIVYLASDKYVVIIRHDGTVDVLTNKFILLHKSKVNTKLILDEQMKIVYSGSISLMSTTAPAYLATTSTGESFLFSDKTAATILLDMSDVTNLAIKEWAMCHDDVGTLKITDNTSGGTALWVNFGDASNIQMEAYRLLSSNGVIGGVVL